MTSPQGPADVLLDIRIYASTSGRLYTDNATDTGGTVSNNYDGYILYTLFIITLSAGIYFFKQKIKIDYVRLHVDRSIRRFR